MSTRDLLGRPRSLLVLAALGLALAAASATVAGSFSDQQPPPGTHIAPGTPLSPQDPAQQPPAGAKAVPADPDPIPEQPVNPHPATNVTPLHPAFPVEPETGVSGADEPADVS